MAGQRTRVSTAAGSRTGARARARMRRRQSRGLGLWRRATEAPVAGGHDLAPALAPRAPPVARLVLVARAPGLGHLLDALRGPGADALEVECRPAILRLAFGDNGDVGGTGPGGLGGVNGGEADGAVGVGGRLEGVDEGGCEIVGGGLYESLLGARAGLRGRPSGRTFWWCGSWRSSATSSAAMNASPRRVYSTSVGGGSAVGLRERRPRSVSPRRLRALGRNWTWTWTLTATRSTRSMTVFDAGARPRWVYSGAPVVGVPPLRGGGRCTRALCWWSFHELRR